MNSDPPVNRRILVIDDNPDIHRDFRKVLAPVPVPAGDLVAAEALLFGAIPASPAQAFELDTASQGEEGLGLVRAAVAAGRPYAVAFVDMRMPPGWDGMETIVRLLPEDPRLQLVICTAFSDYSWQQIFDRVGRTDRLLVVKKPFDPVEVAQLVHALTAKWSLSRRVEGELGRLEQAIAERTRELSDSNRALLVAASESRIAAEQLRRSENRFRAVIESAASAIVIVDHRGIIWLWNPGAERLFGWDAVDAIGRSITDILPGLAGRDLHRSLELLLGDAAGGKRQLELEARDRDGHVLAIELGIAAWRSDEGEFYSCIMQDIGPRKQAESAVRRALDSAEASARAKSDFLAIMSHELRTPMNGIIGMTELLLESRLSGQQVEFAGTVRECAGSLLRLIDDILDFSRIESGRLAIERIEFDVRGTVEGMVDLLEPQARRKGLELVLAVDAAVPEMVEGDPTRLRQVLLNLLGNAVKFTSHGHVQVQIEPAPEIGALRFTVEDSGIGIAAEAQARLFQPFTQADTGITRRFGGSGLGLAVSRRLVALMGGSLAFASTVKVGSRFWFDLPLPPRPQAMAGGGGLSPVGLRVLLVDADPNGRLAMQSLLRSWRMACDAVDGPERAREQIAAAALAGEPYAVIVVERLLGDQDGLELVRQVRAGHGLSALVLAADAQPGLAAAARAAGAAGFLPRPVRRSHLFEAILAIANGTQPGMVTRYRLDEGRRRSRPRVLLVDADAGHRRMVLGTLEREGCRTDVAVAGAGLLSACAASPYALVLLDLDGASAGAAGLVQGIRAGEDPARRCVIVAWSVRDDDALRADCAAAGIDAVLARPDDAGELGARLRQWLPDTDVGEIIIPGGPTLLPLAIDRARLERHASDRPLDDVLDDLGVALPRAVDAVLLAAARDLPDETQAAAGALRQLCEDIGAYALAGQAEGLERLATARDLAGVAQAIGDLHAAARSAENELAGLRRG